MKCRFRFGRHLLASPQKRLRISGFKDGREIFDRLLAFPNTVAVEEATINHPIIGEL